VGDFDGKTFTNSNPTDKVLWVDWGRDNYAGVTWSNAPDGRRLFLGWMSNWQYATSVPTQAWRSANTLPREMKLVQTPDGLRLSAQPVASLNKLRTKTYTIPAQSLSGTLDFGKKSGLTPAQLEVELEVMLPADQKVTWGIELSNAAGEKYRIGLDAAQKRYFSDRRQAGNADFSKEFAKEIIERIK
jgi:fructan beta-fructosidase